MHNGSGVTSNISGGMTAVPEEQMDCYRSGQQNIQEICCSLAHTEALCMFREGEEGHNTPSLISEGLQGGPVKNSTHKIQDTLTSWSRNTWKCSSAGVLP